MKKNQLLFFIFVFNAITVNAQTEIGISSPYDEVKGIIQKFYFNREESAMVLKYNGNVLAIQKFDTKIPSLISRKEYPGEQVFPKSSLFLQFWEFNKHYYVFYSVWDKGNNVDQIFYKEINFEEGQLAENGKLLFTLKREKISVLNIQDRSLANYFRFVNSSDNSKMLIYYKLVPDGKKFSEAIDAIGFHVFDGNLTPVWQQNIIMPYTEQRMGNYNVGIGSNNLHLGDNNKYSIDSNNNIHILIDVFNDEKSNVKESGKDGKPNYRKELLTIKSNTSNVNITPIKIEGKNISSVSLIELPNHKIVCAGYYNKGKELMDVDGVFSFNVDEEGKLFDAKTYEIPLEVLNQFVSDKDQRENETKDKDGKAEIEGLTLEEMSSTKDGGLLLIGEQTLIAISQANSAMHNDDRNSNAILVTKIDAEKKLVWMKKIPKRQFSVYGSVNIGYKHILADGIHYFLFIDNEKNENLPNNKEPEKYISQTKGVLSAYKINDSTGEMKRISFFNTDDVKGQKINKIYVDEIFQTGSNDFMFEVTQKNKKDIMIKATLK